jgi:transcriptional regulator with XRE-family HTH domain
MAKSERNQKLVEARLSQGWTQAQVADKIGTTPGNVNRWEQGKTKPGPHFHRALVTLFNKSAMELGLTPEEENQFPQLPDPATSESRDQNRMRMIKRVRSTWVDGVLRQSLYKATLIALGMETQPDALINPWQMAVQETNLPPRSLPAGTSIVQVFDDSSGELLILGEPGSGKTTLLLELARVLLDRAEQDVRLPIPVVFNLSSWATKKQPLEQWLVEELHIKYRVPLALGQEWIKNMQILALLDGLDEVAEMARASCVKAIKAYKHTYEALPLVVCCRKTEYFAQSTRVALQQAVVILPLTKKQLDNYLARAGKRLADVREALNEDADLQEMVKTPLLLNILILSKIGEAKATLDKVTGSPETRRELIFSVYVNRMLARRRYKKYYTQEQVFHWLGYLARHLQQQNQNELYIERMQPDALLSNPVRFHHAIVQLVCCIETFILAGTLAWLRGGRTFGEVGGGLLAELGNGPWERVLGWMSHGLGLRGLGGGGLVSLVFAIVAVLVGIMIDSTPGAPRQIRVRQGIFKGIRNGCICASLVGLFCFLLFGAHSGFTSGLSYGSSFGILSGLIIGILSGLTTALREEKSTKMRYLQGCLPSLCALISFWGVDAILHVVDDFSYGFVVAVFFYTAYSFGQANERIRISPEIQPAEVVAWSWSNTWRSLPRSVTRGLLIGLITSLSVTVCFGLVSGIARGPSYGVALGLVFGPIIGMSVGVATILSGLLNSGLTSDILQKQDIIHPSEGIRRSAHNAILAAIVFGPIGGIMSGIACGISFGLIGHLTAWPTLTACFALVFGILFGFYFLMIRGLIAVIEHFALRVCLWQAGYVPWNYVRFLNYAAERILLRRIGGGYMFVHRLLLDFFAVPQGEERKNSIDRSE